MIAVFGRVPSAAENYTQWGIHVQVDLVGGEPEPQRTRQGDTLGPVLTT